MNTDKTKVFLIGVHRWPIMFCLEGDAASRRLAECHSGIFAYNRVLLERCLLVRIIAPEMRAAAFFARQGAAGDQQRYLSQVDQLRRMRVARVFQASARLLQARSIANHAAVLPGESADLIGAEGRARGGRSRARLGPMGG